jgi:hypothetical protein
VAVTALGTAEATVLAAVVPVLVVQAVQVWQGRRAHQSAKSAAEQFKPNGGSSLRDAVDRLEYKVDKLHDRHDHLSGRITLIEDHITKPKGN